MWAYGMNSRFFASWVLVLSLLLIVSCSGGSGTAPDGDGVDGDVVSLCDDPLLAECYSNIECAPGWTCDLSTCICKDSTVSDGDADGDSNSPDGDDNPTCNCAEKACISVSPRSLNLGMCQLGDDCIDEFRISNDGGATLNVLDIAFLAGESSPDYSWCEGKEPVLPFALLPDEHTTICVQLSPTDPEKDEGKIKIVSGSCFDSTTHVTLTSQYKGESTVCVEPETWDFGEVDLGTSNPPMRTVTIRNTATDTDSNRVLTISKVEIDPPNSPFFLNQNETVLNNLPFLPPNADTTFNVFFQPNDPGTASAEIIVYHDANNIDETCLNLNTNAAEPVKIYLSGNAVVSCLEITPMPIDFGEVTVDQDLDVYVNLKATEECGGPIVMRGINWQNEQQPEGLQIFDPGNAANAYIPAGTNVSFRMTCSPTREDTFNGFIEIHSNDFQQPDILIPATCKGVLGQIMASPPSVDFSKVRLQENEERVIRIMNTGGGDFSISDIEMRTDSVYYKVFHLKDRHLLQFPITVPPHDERSFTVQYLPTHNDFDVLDLENDQNHLDTGAMVLTLENLSVGSSEYAVSLEGEPVWPLCNFSCPEDGYENFTDTLDFGEVALDVSKTLRLRVTNSGEASCILDPMPYFSPGSSTAFNFAIQSPQPLLTGQFTDIFVTYLPENYPAPASGELVVPTNDFRFEATDNPNMAFTVDLDGHGVNPEIDVYPETSSSTPHSFGEVLLNTCSDDGDEEHPLKVTITNGGASGKLIVEEISWEVTGIEGSWVFRTPVTPQLPAELRPSSQHPEDKVIFEIAFCPLQFVAVQRAVLKIISNDNQHPIRRVHMLGQGVDCDANFHTILPDYPACSYFCFRPTPESQVPYELCDGYDNDCDGRVDEDYRLGEPCDGVGACGPGVIQCLGDRLTMCSSDPGGDDYFPGSPGQENVGPELCDGVDNDCDGKVDEEPWYIGEMCAGQGVCRIGQWRCVDEDHPDYPYARYCDANDAHADDPDICNGLDDNCDGVPDNGSYFIDGSGDPPEICDTGRCVGSPCRGTGGCDGWGSFRCSDPFDQPDQMWIYCSVNSQGEPEVCDGIDNDCDESTDEGQWLRLSDQRYYQKGDNCDGVGGPSDPTTGPCGYGTIECNPENYMAVICSTDMGGSEYNPQAERCDGIDNDCDGEIDEDFNIGGECDGVGECGPGVWVCAPNQEDRICSTDINGPNYDGTAELCDSLDNDCDGEKDNGYPVGEPCVGDGECGNGHYECNGPFNVVCSTKSGGSEYFPQPEKCNGLDDDCDTQVDEDYFIGDDCDGLGECGAGVYECDGLRDYRCSTDFGGSHYQGTLELCDGLDNNCDGRPDEDFRIGDVCTGTGRCSTVPGSIYQCGCEIDPDTGDKLNPLCDPLKSYFCDANPGGNKYPGWEEICNEMDDDCDGSVDEGYDPQHGDDPNNCGGCNTVCDCTGHHCVPGCYEGDCIVAQCSTGWFDTNGSFDDGCECQKDEWDFANLGNECMNAAPLDPFQLVDDNTSYDYVQLISGNLHQGGATPDEDWFKFRAVDAAESSTGQDSDQFHVSVKFTDNNGGEFAFDVYRDNCSQTADLRECTRGSHFEHATDFRNVDPATHIATGQDPCQTDPSVPELNHCIKKDIDYFIRVYRIAPTATCAEYELEISNGFYSSP